MAGISIRKKTSNVIIAIIAILVVVMGLFWTGTATLAERVVTLRYFLFILTALAAFLTPYLLFPDKHIPLLQLANPDQKGLNRYVLARLLSFSWPVFLLVAVMMLGDMHDPFAGLGQKLFSLVSGWFLFSGISLFAVARYIKSGPDSQFWKESEKGRDLRQKVADYLKYPLDPGSIPSLINTVLIVLLGSGAIITGVYLNQAVHPVAEPLFLFFLMLFGIVYTGKLSGTFVRDFYSSNAFFREFFGANLKGEEETEQRQVDQIWWVPRMLRAHVWQFLIQTDRIVPAGRVVFAGHLVVLFIAYQRPDPQFLTIIWVIFALLHHLFILLTFRVDVAPSWLFRWMGSSADWILSRFWMQVRWLLPLLLGMNIQYFLFATPGFQSQAIVGAVFLLSGLAIAALGASSMFKEIKT